jgi:hypothetical protein
MPKTIAVLDHVRRAATTKDRLGVGKGYCLDTRARPEGVDTTAVLVRTSTLCLDVGEIGIGGEVGVSMQTCLKWVVRGEGQIR